MPTPDRHSGFDDGPSVTVRIFGSLRPYCDARQLPYVQVVPVPAEGLTGEDLAESMSMPIEKIEGMFLNHTVTSLDNHIDPGDRVAFVPYDTPGPHRFFLGLYKAGKAHEAAADEGRQPE